MAQQQQPEKPTLVSTKDPYVQPNLPKKIKQVRFSLMSPGEVVSTGDVNVYQGQLFSHTNRAPYPGGPLDPKLGISNRSATCETCGQKLTECTGHFGHIKLELPVFHIGYFKATTQILQCICKTCSHVLLDSDDRRKFLRRMLNPKQERMQKAATFKGVLDKCKRIRLCPWCGSGNGTVKKATGSLKLFHDRYNQKTHFKDHTDYLGQFQEAMSYNEQIRPHVNKVADDLNPMRVLTLFSAITTEDCILLDIADRPEYLIMTHIPVPPVCIRPSVEMDSGQGSNEDDLTVRLRDIILFNAGVRQDLEKGAGVEQLMEHWDMLQVNCAAYINSDLPGLPANHQAAPTKPTRGFVQRLKGKQGRFRGNLSGKRVDFSGRTVISPDPNLRVDEVCVPKLVAQTLTFPDMVTDHNLEQLRQCVLNGVATWPGANFVHFANGQKWYLKYGDRRNLAAELKPGDTVERHIMDGDIALFNRQPSLHRMSIMAHSVRVMPWRTFRFNECVCSPYNADFDGDEMNLHVPQTQEAKTEAQQLMGVMSNLCTPKNGEILIAATQDFLTSAFLLTSKDRFYTRSDFCLLLSYMGDAAEQYDLPVPSILKPVELWTGKQVFSAMVQPNTGTRVYVNLETKEKMYTSGEHMCPADGWVCFRNSQLLCGRLGKATLGGGNKAGLYQVINTDYSSLVAASCMNRLAKLSARFIGNRGFSIGIDDVTPATRLVHKKQQTVATGYDKVQDYIQQYAKGHLQLQPGCDMEESLETLVTGVLNNIREQAAKVCMDTLHWHNSPLNMSQCGSKGSPINIAQMVACVGQQSVGGKRCPNGFKDRSLPHFPRGDKTPEGKGFVASSFYSGLSATEFFFHTMAGREGLVDTAVKTAETGYMSRRLMKSLEDLYTHYDGTVRNAASGIIQLTYGDDGLDPVNMEGKDGSPIDFVRTLSQVKAATPHDDAPDVVVAAAAAPLPGELLHMLDQRLKERELVEDSQQFSGKFVQTLKDFILKQVEGLRGVRKRLGLPIEERGPEEVEVAAGVHGLSERELHGFVDLAVQRYQAKRLDPGSTVGAFGAQSIGEPGTQMTLKTFHFAGVASMNVTLGVPRIKEIINAAKNISTPIAKVALSVTDNATSARMVKGRLEKTTLGQIADHIKVVLRPREGFISIRLDLEVIAKLQLDINPTSVGQALLKHTKLKLKHEHIRTDGNDGVQLHPPHSIGGKGYLATLQTLLQQVPAVIVSGIPTVERAVISKDDKDESKYHVVVEGTDLQKIMGTSGVQGLRTDTNDIVETWKFLGIEAARTIIMTEIQKTMSAHGMAIDVRHTMLLADCMTFKGEVLGITRFGIAKMKDSVLMLASFEKTTDHLFDAALHGRVDDITGVSEAIIMGTPMPVGTGLFKIQHQSHVVLPQPRQLPVLAC